MNATTRALNADLFPPTVAESATVQRTNRSNTGKTFEKEIVTTADAYARANLATLRRVDPPVRVMWLPDKANPGKRTQRVIFQKNPYLDLLGVWTANGGRMILVECKSTATHRLPFRRESGLSDDQFTAIKSWQKAGAAVALLWKWADAVCLWSPQMLHAADVGGAKSLLYADGIHVPRGTCFVVWDFLPVLKATLS